MERTFAAIFKELGSFPEDRSFLDQFFVALRKRYAMGEFHDDSILHVVEFLKDYYASEIGSFIGVAKSRDESRIANKARQLVARFNAEKVPFTAYSFFLTATLKAMGVQVDDEPYRSLAERSAYGPFEGLGAYNEDSKVFQIVAGTLRKYSGDASLVVVPYGVAAIANGVFANRKGLRCVILPNSVTSIGEGVFDNCVDLSDLYIPRRINAIPPYFVSGAKPFHMISKAGIESVGKYAFSGTNVPYSDRFAQVKAIGEGAFKNCPRVEFVILPASCAYVGDDAFAGCEHLRKVDIEGKTVIGKHAFAGDKALKELTANSPEIGAESFLGSGLTKIAIRGGSINKGAFKECRDLTKADLSGDLAIRDEAFLGVPLESLTLGKAQLGNAAFANNPKLKELHFEGDVFLGEGCFQGCKGLSQIDFGPGYLKIGSQAFADCGFAELTLSKSDLQADSFGNNSRLGVLTLQSDEIRFQEGAFRGCVNLTKLRLPSLCNQMGISYFALFGRDSFNRAEPVEVGGGTYYVPQLESLFLQTIRIGQPFPKGLKVKRLRVHEAKVLPANVCLDSLGLEILSLGPEVQNVGEGFLSSGARIEIDPQNSFLRHRDGLLLSADEKSVKAILDPKTFRMDAVKGFQSVGRGVLRDLHFDRFELDSTWPRFAAGAFERCVFDELIVKDWTRLEDEAFRECAVRSLIIEDTVHPAKRLDLSKPILSLQTSSLAKGALTPFASIPVGKLIVASADSKNCEMIPAREIELRDSHIEGLTLRDAEISLLLLENCALRSVTFERCKVEEARMRGIQGKSLSFPDSEIQRLLIQGGDSYSLDSFHCGSSPVKVGEMRLTAGTLSAKSLSPMEAETMRLRVGSLQDDALREVNGNSLFFETPLTTVGEEAFANSFFEAVTLTSDSCIGLDSTKRFLVRKEDGLAFYALGSGIKELTFSSSLSGYAQSLIEQLAATVEKVTISDAEAFGDSALADMVVLKEVVTVDLGMPLCEAFPSAPIERVHLLDETIGLGFLSGLDRLVFVSAERPLLELGDNAFANDFKLTSLPDLSQVATVGEFCFSGCRAITALALPKATEIGQAAFDQMAGLKSLEIPFAALESHQLAEYFSKYGFSSSTKVDCAGSVYYVPTSLREIVLRGENVPPLVCQGFRDIELKCPDPIRAAGKDAFTAVRTASLQLNLSQLETALDRAFAGVRLPDELELPNIIFIGPKAFEGAKFFSVHFGPKLTSLSLDFFDNVRRLTLDQIHIDPGKYRLEQGCLCALGQIVLALPVKDFPAELTIPSSIEALADGCFQGNQALRSLTLRSHLEVGKGALDNLTALEELTIPDDTVFLSPIVGASALRRLTCGAYSFEDEDHLARLLPDSLNSLKELRLSLKLLPKDYLKGFASLESLSLSCHAHSFEPGTLELPALRELCIKNDRLVSLSKAVCPSSSALQTLDLSGCPKLTYDDFAFADAKSLQNVRLPSLSVPFAELFQNAKSFDGASIDIAYCPTIPASMFRGLSKVASISIGTFDGVIGDYAFADLGGAKFSFGSKVTKVGKNAFAASSFPFDASFFSSIEEIGERAFLYGLFEKVELPSIVRVEAEAFMGASYDQMKLGPSLRYVGPRAFPNLRLGSADAFSIASPLAMVDCDCVYLDNVLVLALDYPGVSSAINVIAGAEVASGAVGGERARTLASLSLSGDTVVHSGAFVGLASLNELHILDDEVVLEEGAITGCERLKSLQIDASGFPEGTGILEALGPMPELRSLIAKMRMDMFPFLDQCTRLEDASITLIGSDLLYFEYAFKCTGLRELSLAGEGILGFTEDCFFACAKLEKLNLLDCPYLEPGLAFLSPLTNLTSLSIPSLKEPLAKQGKFPKLAHVTLGACDKLRDGVFADMPDLKSVHFQNASVTSIGKRAFANTTVTLESRDLANLTLIDEEAFAGATLTINPLDSGEVSLPNLSMVEEGAFEDARIIPSVTKNHPGIHFGAEKVTFAEGSFRRYGKGATEASETDAFHFVGDVEYQTGAFEGASGIRLVHYVQSGHVRVRPHAFSGICHAYLGLIAPTLAVEERAFADLGEDVSILFLALEIKGGRLFENSRTVNVTLPKELLKTLDKSHPEWRRFAGFGRAPGLFARMFHSTTIHVETLD